MKSLVGLTEPKTHTGSKLHRRTSDVTEANGGEMLGWWRRHVAQYLVAHSEEEGLSRRYE